MTSSPLGEQGTDGWICGRCIFLVREEQPGETARGLLSGDFLWSQWPFISSRCWFREKIALYVTVHGYCLIVFLFSAAILSLVSWKIFTLSSATAGKEKGQHWKGVLTLLGLSCLVGLPWGLALLTSLGPFTAYVFALFTSLQGEAPGLGRRRAAFLHQRVLGGFGGRCG